MFTESEDDSIDSDEEGLDPYDERLNQAFWDTRTWILQSNSDFFLRLI